MNRAKTVFWAFIFSFSQYYHYCIAIRNEFKKITHSSSRQNISSVISLSFTWSRTSLDVLPTMQKQKYILIQLFVTNLKIPSELPPISSNFISQIVTNICRFWFLLHRVRLHGHESQVLNNLNSVNFISSSASNPWSSHFLPYHISFFFFLFRPTEVRSNAWTYYTFDLPLLQHWVHLKHPHKGSIPLSGKFFIL